MFCGLTFGLSWRMSHVHLRWIYILLLLLVECSIYVCQVQLVYIVIQVLCLLIDLLSGYSLSLKNKKKSILYIKMQYIYIVQNFKSTKILPFLSPNSHFSSEPSVTSFLALFREFKQNTHFWGPSQSFRYSRSGLGSGKLYF